MGEEIISIMVIRKSMEFNLWETLCTNFYSLAINDQCTNFIIRCGTIIAFEL